ncbi:MAG: phage tail tape measure protein [Roseburia sp.]|nr:phage tail tape measure protein [Roseburia sp.]
MSNELKRVGLVFKSDGAVDFQKTLKSVNAAVKENKTQFQMAKSTWDESTSSMEKLGARQNYLSSQTRTYSDKVKLLKEELAELESAEKKDEKAISDKRNQLNSTQATLNYYKKNLADVERQMKDGTAQMDEMDDSIEKVNANIKESEQDFKHAQSQWKESTSVTKKLRDEQKYLSEQTDSYSQKAKLLKDELSVLEGAEEKNEQAIRDKRSELVATETELNNYKIKLDETEKKLALGSAQLKDYAEKIGNVGEKATSAGKTASVALTTPILGAATASVKLATDFESAMSQVRAISGATEEDFQKLKKTAEEYGESTQYSNTECANAMQYMALAGWNADQIVNNLGGVLDLAAASGMDLAAASDIVTDYLSAFSNSAITSTKLADEMAYAQANSNTSVEQLSEAYRNCAANMNANSQSVETTTALLSAMADQGFKGSEAGTALTAMMRDLTNSMEDGAITINGQTIQIQDANGNYKDMIEIIAGVESAVSGMGDAERAAALSSVFTSDSMKGLNYVLTSGSSSIADFASKLSACDGTAADMAATMNDNFAGELKSFNSKLQAVGTDIGEILIPSLSDLFDHLSDLLTWFKGLDDSQKNTIIRIAAIVAAIGPMLIIFGSICGGISNILTVASQVGPTISIIKTGVASLNAVMAANPIILIIAAIAALVAAFVYLWNNCEEFRQFWLDLWDTISSFFEGRIETMKEGFEVIHGFFNDLPGNIEGGIESFKEKVSSGVEDVKEDIEGKFTETYKNVDSITNGGLTAALSTAKQNLSNMKSAYDEAGGGMKGIMAGAIEGIKGSFQTGFTFVDTFSGGKLSNMVSNVSGKMDEAHEACRNAIERIKKIFDFDWHFPKLKLPHFSATGSFSLNPLKVPTIDVDWYANGGILNKPTIFGANGNSLLGGGEAGKEVVAPLTDLKAYMREVNAQSNVELVQAIKDGLGDVFYNAFIKALRTVNPSVVLDDEKVGEFVLDLLRKEVFT